MGTKLNKYSDPELFDLVQKKDKLAEEAFAELYDRHSPRVYAYCKRFLGNKEEAQDVLQDTFIRLFKSAKKDKEMTNVSAYIITIARNVCLTRKRQEEPNISFEEYMAVRENYNKDEDELLDLIKMAIEVLPEDYREVFILREYDGLSYKDIAEITESSMNNVKVRIYRAKQRVKEILAPYLEDISKHQK